MKKLSFQKKMIFLGLLLLGLFLCAFLIGRYPMGPVDVIKVILSRFAPVTRTWSDTVETVVFDVRLPRILMAILVGAGLSCTGSTFQGIFKNPLVSPDLLGVTAAAGLGAAIGIMLDAGSATVQLLAFVAGIVGVSIALFISRIKGSSPMIMLVLSGVVVKSLFDAGIAIIKCMADPLEKLPAITYWLMGSLSATRWEHIAVAAPIILLCMGLLCALGWRINVLSMGDKEARSLGVRTERAKMAIVACSTLICATTVCMCGNISWVGLVIPHIARMFVGPDYRKLMPASILIGASFLLIVDGILRSMMATLPVSVMTSLIGAPFFAVLIRRTKGGWNR